jgi:hypothetical protein
MKAFSILALFCAIDAALAQQIPKGFVVPNCSLSPDKRLGVTVPILDEHNESEGVKNSVIDLTTGKIIAVIKTPWIGWTRMNHGGVLPCRWSPDGSLLVWTVDGKWFPDAVVLLKFKGGALEWQADITALAEAETLQQTKRAVPKKYALARRANEGSGSAYPEGFSIYVDALDPIALPLRVRATLTADPKGIPGQPKLESCLTGIIDRQGKLVVKDFHVGEGYWEKFAEPERASGSCDFANAAKVDEP